MKKKRKAINEVLENRRRRKVKESRNGYILLVYTLRRLNLSSSALKFLIHEDSATLFGRAFQMGITLS